MLKALKPRTCSALLAMVPVLIVLATPAAAAEPSDGERTRAVAALHGASAEAVLFDEARPTAAADELSAQGTIIAECCDGSTVTCAGSSGHFADADCDSGQRGYCHTSESGTRYCPSCSSPSCQSSGCAGASSCQQLNGTSCAPSGASTSCATQSGNCGLCSCVFSMQWMCTLEPPPNP